MTKVITPFEAAALDIKAGAVTAAAGIAIGYRDPTLTNVLAIFNPRAQSTGVAGAGGLPMEFLGLQIVTNGNKVRRTGVLELANWSAALVSGAATLLPGRSYYVGNSVGQLDTVPQDWVVPLPLSATASQQVIVQPVGFALSATKLMIVPGKRRVRQYLQAGPLATLNKIAWAKDVSVLIQQSGAGGGAGRKGLAGTIRSGGGGGIRGSRFGFKYKVSELPGTGVIAITNPVASAGAVSQTVDNTNGISAAFVSPTIVSIGGAVAMTQFGSNGGLGGTAAGSGTPSNALPVSMPLRQPIPTDGNTASGGSSATGGVGASGIANPNGVSGAGSGGGVASANVPADGATSPASGALASSLFQSVAGAVGGLASGNIGGLGASWTRLMAWASSGAGGAGTIIGNGGNGGAGGFPGGGGGGGGASVNGVGVFSGAGGAGANGCSLVTWEE